MHRNPIPTVDIIIEFPRGIVLIQRKNPPYGWALPGGFVDYGESLEMAAIREAAEETGLEIELLKQLYTYSNPSRDSRHHTISTVFIAKADGMPKAGSDATLVKIAAPPWPVPLVFDHETVLSDYLAFREDRFFNPLTKIARGL